MGTTNRLFGAYLLLASSLLCFPTAAETPSEPILRFYTELVAPFYWLDEKGSPQGAALELAIEIMNESGLKSEIEHLPWARAYHDTVNTPDVVLLTALKTEERKPRLQWLGKVHTARAYLVGLADTEFPAISNLEQAKRFRVGTIRGYGAATYLKQQGFEEGKNLELLLQPEQLWTMLFKKRIDFVLSNLSTGVFEIKEAGFDPNHVERIFHIEDLTVDLEMATGNKTSPEVVDALRKALQQLKSDGRYEAIMRKWKLIETSN